MVSREMFVCLVLLVLGCTGPVFSVTDQPKSAVIQAAVENVVASHPGIEKVVVSIYNKKYTRFITYHYKMDRYSKRMIEDQNSRDSHCVGGITRGLTALMLHRLLSKSNYTWNTPVAEILEDEVTLPDLYRSNNVNLKDIFSMRTGLSGIDIVPVVGAYDRGDLLRKLKYLPVVAGFREKFVYNEVLFTLVDLVIEKLTNMSVVEAIEQELIRPFLGKNGAEFFWNSTRPERISYSSLVASASSLCIEDYNMGRLLRFLCERSRLMVDVNFDEIFQGIQSRGDVDPYYSGMNALGWVVGHFEPTSDGNVYRAISLGGSFKDHDQSLLKYLRDRNIAVFVSFQGRGDENDFAAKYLLTNEILRLELDAYKNPASGKQVMKNEFDSMTRLFKRKSSDSEDRPCSIYEDCGVQRLLDEFEGVYRNFAFGEVKVSFNQSGNEQLTMEYGDAVYQLKPSKAYNNTFYVQGGSYHPAFTSLYKVQSKAAFKAAQNDPENRIFSVTFTGFDHNVDPEFSLNPGETSYEKRKEDGAECSACSLAVSLYCVLALTLLSCLSV